MAAAAAVAHGYNAANRVITTGDEKTDNAEGRHAARPGGGGFGSAAAASNGRWRRFGRVTDGRVIGGEGEFGDGHSDVCPSVRLTGDRPDRVVRARAAARGTATTTTTTTR